MKKRKVPNFLAAAVLVALTLLGIGKTEASDCYQLFYNWDCVTDHDFDIVFWKTALVSKHKDHTIKLEGEYLGVWNLYGDSFNIDSFSKFYIDNSDELKECNPLFTGYKTMYGFMVCRNGATADKPPGCWLMMKLKPKDCPWITEK